MQPLFEKLGISAENDGVFCGEWRGNGAVIEKITGKPWHVAIQTQLLEPLGLKHTTFGAASAFNRARDVTRCSACSDTFTRSSADATEPSLGI